MSERTDRELLELAAKAAGVCGGWGEVHALPQGEIDCTDLWLLDGDDYPYVWNPLTDDGDALRLAVDLCMILTAMTAFCGARSSFVGRGTDLPTLGEDRREVMRRAIVTAAAEIGANMQS